MDRATSPRPSARPAAAAAAAAASASASAAAAAAAATSAMGASVTKCLGSQCEDLPAAPPRPAGPPPSARTFDLEELGLLAAPAAVRAAERSVEVAYEHENAAAIPHRDRRARRRPVADACTPDACAPLDKSAAASASASASASGRPRGRVVAAKEPSKPSADDADRLSTSATDNEEEDERCSKTHKLCMCELRRHRAADDCWLAAYGNVYDVTGILRAHPGGARSLLRKAGGPDCSSDMDFHTRKARRMMDHCFVGKLQPCGDDADAGQANCSIM